MKHTNKKPRRGMNLHHYFSLIVLGEILLVLFVVYGLTHLMRDVLLPDITVSPILWMAAFGLLVGSGCAVFVSRVLLKRIVILSRSMQKVAKGDFSIRLDTRSSVKELRETQSSFNSMVEQLSKIETLQSDFISSVSHEFKTPINAIEGYATLLEDKSLSEEDRALYLDRIRLSTQKLSQLVGNVLLISKMDNTTEHGTTNAFRLDEQICQAIILLEPKWASKNIEIDADLCEIIITAQQGLLGHIWTNLIENAIRFAPRDGCLRIRLWQEDGECIFTVEDDGPGIDESALPYIFNKFYQADSSHKSEGNGLGLAIASKIAAIHNGKISAQNNPDRGAKFTVSLPLS